MQDYQDLAKLRTGYIQKTKELEHDLAQYAILSENMAAAERDYRIAKSNATLILKEEGMQATLIPTVVNGKVASERFEWKKAEGLFHACRENIKRLHANLDAYRSLLSTAKSEMEIR